MLDSNFTPEYIKNLQYTTIFKFWGFGGWINEKRSDKWCAMSDFCSPRGNIPLAEGDGEQTDDECVETFR